MKISIVVAMAENRVIGMENGLPWHLPEDLKRFKAITMGHPMIMGRKTFDSIGRALPGRKTIVVTRNAEWPCPEGVLVAADMSQAISTAELEARVMGVEQIMVVGGGTIYQQSIALADSLYVTEVHTLVEGDAYFPEISPKLWSRVATELFASDKAPKMSYSFVEYAKACNV